MIVLQRLTQWQSWFNLKAGKEKYRRKRFFAELLGILLLTLIITLLLPKIGFTQPLQSIKILAPDFPPYLGSQQQNQGAAYDIIQHAFAKSGIQTSIQFYPEARAVHQVLVSQADAVMVIGNIDDNAIDVFETENILSLQFMKLQMKPTALSDHPNISRLDLPSGIVRSPAEEHIKSLFPSEHWVTTEKPHQLLKMLKSGRVTFAVLEQFSAADAMVDKLPSLIGQIDIERSNTVIKLSINFPKNAEHTDAFLEQLRYGIKQLTATGEFDDILERHGLLGFKPAEKDITRLRIATVNNPDMLNMQRLTSYYEAEHPHIKIEWRTLEENQLRRRLLANIAVGISQYDIMTIGSYEAPLWAQKGWLVSPEPLSAAYEVDDLLPPVRASLSFNHSLFALPFYAESSALFYRQDLFDNAGLIMPEQPTYDAIENFARQLHDPSKHQYGICLRTKPGWGENIALISTMVNSAGGQWFNLQWQPQLLTPQWQDALKRYLTLLQNWGPLSLNHPLGYLENLNLFAEGKCAMWVDATVAASTLFDAQSSSVSGVVAMAPAPIIKTGIGSRWLWSWALAVPTSSADPDPALDFIRWATSKRYITLVQQQLGKLATPAGTRYSTYQDPQYLLSAPFAQSVVNSILQSTPDHPTALPSPYQGVGYVGIPEFSALGNEVGWNIYRALMGEMSLNQALSDSQRFIQQVDIQATQSTLSEDK